MNGFLPWALADQVSRKVLELDLAQSSFNSTLHRIDAIVEQSNCIDGVNKALNTEDFKSPPPILSRPSPRSMLSTRTPDLIRGTALPWIAKVIGTKFERNRMTLHCRGSTWPRRNLTKIGDSAEALGVSACVGDFARDCEGDWAKVKPTSIAIRIKHTKLKQRVWGNYLVLPLPCGERHWVGNFFSLFIYFWFKDFLFWFTMFGNLISFAGFYFDWMCGFFSTLLLQCGEFEEVWIWLIWFGFVLFCFVFQRKSLDFLRKWGRFANENYENWFFVFCFFFFFFFNEIKILILWNFYILHKLF